MGAPEKADAVQTDAALALNYLFAAPRHVNVATGAETTGTLQQRRMKHDL